MLVCAYLLRLHRKNELAMQAVCQEDLITEWCHPSPAMQSAATVVQGKFRRAKQYLSIIHGTSSRSVESLSRLSILSLCSFASWIPEPALFWFMG